VKEQLYINNIYIPLSKSINPSITKSITDVENPDKRKATYTKTVELPATPELNKVLGHIFDINISDCTFDVTVKADCVYIVNGEPLMEGYCQLKSINQLHQQVESYNIVIGGGIADLFGELGENELIELGSYLDQWNHPFTKQVQAWSWATQVWNADNAAFQAFAIGTGYVYPLIDYGKTTSLNYWEYYEMSCALYAKEYINAIQDYTGLTFESTFLDSTYFKSLIIPAPPDVYQLTATEITDREFQANTPNFTSTGTTSTANLPTSPIGWSTPDTIIFTNELTDPSLVYDNATGKFTCSSTTAGWFSINTIVQFYATFTPSTGTSVVQVSDISGYLMIYKNGAQVQSIDVHITYDDYPSTFSTGARTTATVATYPDTDYTTADTYSAVSAPAAANLVARNNPTPNQYELTANGVYLQNGDYIEVKWKGRYNGLGGTASKMFVDSFGNFYGGSATVTASVGSFYTKYSNLVLEEGATLDITKTIPKKIKIKDFFMSIVKMFNLWIDVHPTKTNTLVIEPREDFLTNDILDVQSKLAHDKPLEIYPMARLDANDYMFTYKEDKDYLNVKYTASYNQIYGERRIFNTNDFTTQQKKTELIFSPTPLSAPSGSTRVLSTIIALDDQGQATSTEHNTRILFYGGLKNANTNWQLNGAGFTPITYTTYPYAGHFDDPFTATEDINFGLVNEVYYDDNITTINITNNNLYNKYYSKMLNEYTDKESKVVTAYFNISPADFRNWTFTKLYYFENAYFRLQKIEGYNPTAQDLTKCEFLYLTNAPNFIPVDFDLNGDNPPVTGPPSTGSLDDTETKPTKGDNGFKMGDGNNANGKTVTIKGTYNFVASDSYFIDISGDSNYVHSNTKNVSISGDSNTIQAGCENVTLINTSGVTVEKSNVTYLDGKLLGDWIIEDAGFVVDDVVYGYYLDGSTAGVQVRLNSSESEFFFKCLDDTNRVYIDAAPFTIDNTAAEFDLVANESIRIKWNETNQTYYIIN
jgi:hypothetical protein